MLWLRGRVSPDLLTIEKCLVRCGLAGSVTAARRLVDDGAVYLNNEKVTRPGPDFTGLLLGRGEILRDFPDSPDSD